MSETWALGLSEGLRKIAAGELTAAGWLRALLDRIDVAGPPCEAGSPLFAGRVAETDATAVARLGRPVRRCSA